MESSYPRWKHFIPLLHVYYTYIAGIPNIDKQTKEVFLNMLLIKWGCKTQSRVQTEVILIDVPWNVPQSAHPTEWAEHPSSTKKTSDMKRPNQWNPITCYQEKSPLPLYQKKQKDLKLLWHISYGLFCGYERHSEVSSTKGRRRKAINFVARPFKSTTRIYISMNQQITN